MLSSDLHKLCITYYKVKASASNRRKAKCTVMTYDLTCSRQCRPSLGQKIRLTSPGRLANAIVVNMCSRV